MSLLDDIYGVGAPAVDYLGQALAGPRQAAGLIAGPTPAPAAQPSDIGGPDAAWTPAPFQVPDMPPSPPIPSVQSPRERDPYLQRLAETADAQQLAAMRQAHLQSARDAYAAEQSSLAAARSARQQREIEDQRKQWDEETDKKLGELEAERKQLADARINPGRVYADASTGAKIATIAMGALAGFLNPKGGAAAIVEQIQGLVDRDVQAQLANLEQRNRALGAKQQGIQTEAQVNERRLDAALRADALAYDTATRIIAAEAGKINSPIAAEKAQEMAAQIRQAQADKAMAYRMQRSQLGLQYAQLDLQRQRMAQEDAAQKADQAAVPKNAVANTGDPRGYSTLINEAAVPKTIERKDGAERFIALNRQLYELRQQYPGHQWDNFLATSDGKALMNSIKQDIVVAYGQMNGQGAMGDEEAERYMKSKIGGDVGAWINPANPEVWKQNIRTAEDSYNRYMRTVSPGFPGGLVYDVGTEQWVQIPRRQERGQIGSTGSGSASMAIRGKPIRGRVSPNALGVDMNGNRLDVPPVRSLLPDEEYRTTFTDPLLFPGMMRGR